ncbi:MAG TPA: hypothetical protein VJX67_04055 [Blastocatellia bacterium]|nr:hypothetical protein [Blastocatellia bacterium]
MSKQISKTVVLVCRGGFSRIVERMLEKEGISDFQRGGLSLVGGSAIEARVGGGASDVFVLTGDRGSTGRLVGLMAACPIRGGVEDRFELYTVGD